MSLQELCRFKIRKTIRDSIHSEFSDYYAIKREKSNFNKREAKKQMPAYSSYLNDSQDENESDLDDFGGRPNYPITRFERIFTPNSNADFSSNNFEQQIRLMIYGHLLDAANSSLQLAVNAANEINNSESESENEQIGHVLETNNNEASDHESSNESVLHDFNVSDGQKNGDENSEESDANSEADLFELFAENCRKARSSGNLL